MTLSGPAKLTSSDEPSPPPSSARARSDLERSAREARRSGQRGVQWDRGGPLPERRRVEDTV